MEAVFARPTEEELESVLSIAEQSEVSDVIALHEAAYCRGVINTILWLQGDDPPVGDAELRALEHRHNRDEPTEMTPEETARADDEFMAELAKLDDEPSYHDDGETLPGQLFFNFEEVERSVL